MKEIKFYRTRDLYGEFSNFSDHAIYLDERIWRTSEHYFQAMKFEQRKRQEIIRSVQTPKEAAKLGRDRRYPIKEHWDILRIDIMKEALRAKFTQHPNLRSLLIDTGDAVLIEDSPTDYFWGCGKERVGMNMLGKLLMLIRDELR